MTRRLGRAPVVDASDKSAANGAEVEAFGDRVVDILDAHAEPAAPSLAIFLQLVDDRLDRVGRGGEADPDGAAGGRQNRRVDANDFAVHIEEGTAGIALVDGGVRLDVIIIGSLSILRLRAETMPAVTEPPRPNGLPTASTQSPTRDLSLSPNLAAFNGFSGFTRSTATSTF